MSSARIQQAKAIKETYQLVRKALTEDEQPLFDEAVDLLEKLSAFETPHALLLDMGISAALACITLPVPAYTRLGNAMSDIIIEALVENHRSASGA